MLSSLNVAHAKNFNVDFMDVTAARIEAPFFNNETNSMTLNVISGENLVGGYISALTSTFFGPGGEQILYTAESNQNPHGVGTPAGVIPGGPVPSGTVNMKRKTITVDMSSFFAAHGPMDQNLGGTAKGTYDPSTGEYTMSWSATLTQGMNAGQVVTFVLSGTAEVSPAKRFKKYRKKMNYGYMNYMK